MNPCRWKLLVAGLLGFLLAFGFARAQGFGLVNQVSPPALNKYVIGAFTGIQVTAVVASQNFGAFTPSVVGTSQKLGNVQCMLVGTSAGVGAAGTLVIYDVTAAANLCTPYNANFNCASAAGVGTAAASCNAALTAGHQYSYRLSGCTGYPTGFECTTEILAPCKP